MPIPNIVKCPDKTHTTWRNSIHVTNLDNGIFYIFCYKNALNLNQKMNRIFKVDNINVALPPDELLHVFGRSHSDSRWLRPKTCGPGHGGNSRDGVYRTPNNYPVGVCKRTFTSKVSVISTAHFPLLFWYRWMELICINSIVIETYIWWSVAKQGHDKESRNR